LSGGERRALLSIPSNQELLDEVVGYLIGVTSSYSVERANELAKVKPATKE